jgi:hypothetical protein
MTDHDDVIAAARERNDTPEFLRLDPPNPWCIFYTSGYCCQDLHFDVSTAFPEKVGPLCMKGEGEESTRTTADSASVNCKECRELLFS